MTHIVVASQSKIKLDAVNAAFASLNENVTIEGVRAISGVPQQPEGEETQTGATARLLDAQRQIQGADLYIAIENGVFVEDEKILDRACVAIYKSGSGKLTIAFSEAVELPRIEYERAKRRGFEFTTIGHVMQQQGLISYHADPHITLSGKPRAEYIKDAILKALKR